MRLISGLLLILLTVYLNGCSTVAPTGALISVPKSHKTSCAKICKNLGMKLGSMVIIRNSTGCVCNVKVKKTSNMTRIDSNSAGAAAGAVVSLLIQEEESRRKRQ